jgi:tagatose 1,6-diphosphate aldolase
LALSLRWITCKSYLLDKEILCDHVRLLIPSPLPHNGGMRLSPLSIGKIRGLQQIAGPDGVFTMCAMDHRGSLEHAICAPDRPEDCPRDMTSFKLELCEILAPHASAVLLDPIYGVAQAIARNLIPKTCGVLVSLEETGYTGDAQNRQTRLLEGWGVAELKRMGASAAKMLVYYRPELAETSRKQLALVEAVALECQKFDIPFLVEPVAYPIRTEVGDAAAFATTKTKVVIQTARAMTSLPIDVLKAEFPADLSYELDEKALIRACSELDAASAVPWVILSAGTSFEPFLKEVEIACKCGASGFLAGRAVWQEAVGMTDPADRCRFLKTTATDRLKSLSEIASKLAVPWFRKRGLDAASLADITPQWYTSYGGME